MQSAANLWGYIEKAITLFTLQNCSFLHYFSRWHWTAWRSKYIRLQIILKLNWQWYDIGMSLTRTKFRTLYHIQKTCRIILGLLKQKLQNFELKSGIFFAQFLFRLSTQKNDTLRILLKDELIFPPKNDIFWQHTWYFFPTKIIYFDSIRDIPRIWKKKFFNENTFLTQGTKFV